MPNATKKDTFVVYVNKKAYLCKAIEQERISARDNATVL